MERTVIITITEDKKLRVKAEGDTSVLEALLMCNKAIELLLTEDMKEATGEVVESEQAQTDADLL